MKIVSALLFTLLSASAMCAEEESLTADQLTSLVEQVTAAQNAVMRQGSTVEDADNLFAMYADDFTYVHEVYGGTYTREGLYANTVRYLKSGGYTMEVDRYEILRMIPGKDAVAVEREENSGAIHLAVFEFDGGKVSRIIEYWE